MRKRDINGNTVNKNARHLSAVINNMTAGTYRMDSVGYILVDTAGGGHIIFYADDFPKTAEHVFNNLQRK